MRLSNSLTLADIAKQSGVTISSLSMLETGVRSKRVDLDTLRRIAVAVGYESLAHLIKSAEGMK